MKRVVVQVCTENGGEQESTRVEKVVPDESARMLLSALLELNEQDDSFAVPDRIVELLVKRELAQVADADESLFDRLMARVERTLLSLVYAECDHVQTRTAGRLGIDRNTLHKKLSKYNLLNS